MLISENEIELESLIQRHLYENGYKDVDVTINIYGADVEMSIYADGKHLTLNMLDDTFKNEKKFYAFTVKQIEKNLR